MAANIRAVSHHKSKITSGMRPNMGRSVKNTVTVPPAVKQKAHNHINQKIRLLRIFFIIEI